MPKICLIEADRESECLGRNIRSTIVLAETEHDVPRSETIKASGMSTANFYTAWKDPSKFRVGQLLKIYKFLKVPETERRYT